MAKTLKDPPKDPLFESERVYRLRSSNFKDFLRSKDLVMVMFYNPRNIESLSFSKHFNMAAFNTLRRNHAYAAVNCMLDSNLCTWEKAIRTPIVKLYTKNMTLATLRDLSSVTDENITALVEQTKLPSQTKNVLASIKD